VIGAMRRFARKDAPNAIAVDPVAAVREAVHVTAADHVRRGVTAEVAAVPVPPVLIDPVQFQQVLVNLLLNAADAVATLPAARRRVVVHIEACEDGRVCIAVQDDGPGFAPDALGHLLEPFFTTKADGLGLGLPLARSIVEAHGGTLRVESAPGEGACVTVRLPLAPLPGGTLPTAPRTRTTATTTTGGTA
jgi:signal transduction histidine kinase